MELPRHRDFFGESGLTSTSANYIANKAKEYISVLEARLQNINLFSTDISIIGAADAIRTVDGVTREELLSFDSNLKDIAELKTLIAYLREAIKEKDRLFRECKALKFEHPDLIEPVKEEYLDVEDIVSSWSKDKLLSWFHKDTVASTYGKFIHPGGPFSTARKKYHGMKPVEYKDNGRDTIISKNTTALHPADVDGTFYSLQEKQRNAQAELNGIKHEVDVAIQENVNKVDSEYSQKVNAYVILKQKYDAEDKIVRNALMDEAQALKIEIPKSLYRIYEAVRDDSFHYSE